MKKKERLGWLDKVRWNKLFNRSTLETLHTGNRVTITDIVVRAIDKEIENFKPLVKK
jgi:hypothetical protein